MKFKKVTALVIVGMFAAGAMSGCGAGSANQTSATVAPATVQATASAAATESAAPATAAASESAAATQSAAATEPAAPAPSAAAVDQALADAGLDANLKFTDTKHITVEVFDRNADNETPPDTNYFAQYIKDGMLRDHNVDVTFVTVPRWTEDTEINNLMAAGSAPDVCVTYSAPTISTYGQMGAVVDMNPLLTEYKDYLPNLYSLLGNANVYYDQDPVDQHLWSLEALLYINARTSVFVRQDWLQKLNIPTPTTIDGFESMLQAFKDNAQTLLGADADKMVPYSVGYDVGWRADHLFTSFIPNDITDKDWYTHGFDDRRFTEPNIKEGIRVLNKWYNEGLVWKDFSLYSQGGDPTEDNMIKAGYVGAFEHNWDYPYRNGDDSIDANLQRLVGPDAQFVAVDCFQNDAGLYRKYLSSPVDRKVFFPITNNEPVASLLYLDWISNLQNLNFLQTGDEGVNHQTQPDGSIKMLTVTADSATKDRIMNSPNNIDYTITVNGLDLGDMQKSLLSLAQNYSGVDPGLIQTAYNINQNDARIAKAVNVGIINAETGIADALKNKRDTTLNTSITTTPDKFDSVFDAGMQDYLASGGQAIIDERTQKWEQFYGSAVNLP